MSIFAVSDLHLSFAPGVEKPMDIYGSRWHRHWQRLEQNWREIVSADDIVIIPGDISWAMKLDEAVYDLNWISDLPGKKVLFKGNHDMWWSGITKLNNMYENMTFVQNDYYRVDDLYICGTRGWMTPDNDDFGESDMKLYKREQLRLEASLSAASKAMNENDHILGVLHYPPVSKITAFSAFQQIFESYGVKRVIYGHIHGEEGFRGAIQGVHHGIEYNLVSVDYLNCVPICIEK